MQIDIDLPYINIKSVYALRVYIYTLDLARYDRQRSIADWREKWPHDPWIKFRLGCKSTTLSQLRVNENQKCCLISPKKDGKSQLRIAKCEFFKTHLPSRSLTVPDLKSSKNGSPNRKPFKGSDTSIATILRFCYVIFFFGGGPGRSKIHSTILGEAEAQPPRTEGRWWGNWGWPPLQGKGGSKLPPLFHVENGGLRGVFFFFLGGVYTYRTQLTFFFFGGGLTQVFKHMGQFGF